MHSSRLYIKVETIRLAKNILVMELFIGILPEFGSSASFLSQG
ncbi:hypothetical protein PIECOFPK_02829 [Mycovorax composti]|jgi:hypothetical protein|uniref:Uncharacterized protein n=1 Tax=Mycovorax composti TaxID=2962693 RepID=A0ABZ2EP40_9BACT